jgi:hypothetical protein
MGHHQKETVKCKCNDGSDADVFIPHRVGQAAVELLPLRIGARPLFRLGPALYAEHDAYETTCGASQALVMGRPAMTNIFDIESECASCGGSGVGLQEAMGAPCQLQWRLALFGTHLLPCGMLLARVVADLERNLSLLGTLTFACEFRGVSVHPECF